MSPMSRTMQWGMAFGGILAKDLGLPCQQSKEQTNHSRSLPKKEDKAKMVFVVPSNRVRNNGHKIKHQELQSAQGGTFLH